MASKSGLRNSFHSVAITSASASFKAAMAFEAYESPSSGPISRCAAVMATGSYALTLALAPHVAPHLLDVFFLKNEKTERGFTEFGGVKGIHHAGFVPTGETALFLLCGDDVAARLATLPLLEPTHPMYVKGPLRLATPQPDEPSWSGALGFSPSYLRHLTTGEEPRPELGVAFPARPVTTTLTWDDLVLDPKALAEVGEIKIWALHEDELLHQWGLGRHVKPGYRALFHGPSGTG